MSLRQPRSLNNAGPLRGSNGGALVLRADNNAVAYRLGGRTVRAVVVHVRYQREDVGTLRVTDDLLAGCGSAPLSGNRLGD